MKLVFSFGGSVVAPDNVDRKFVRELSAFLKTLSEKHTVVVVVGGGAPARRDIRRARAAGFAEAYCDFVGIKATRRNAGALVRALGGKANAVIPESVQDAVKLVGRRILVMGGTEPGHSTDAVAALVAEWIKADLLVNASNVDAVYNKDPRKFHNAKPLKSVGVDRLIRLLEDQSVAAGQYPLMDPTSLKLIKRSKIKTVILDGRDLGNIRNAIYGSGFKGTQLTC